MTEWQDIRIGDLGRVVTGKTPPTSKPEYYGGTMQFLTPTDMDGRRIINQTLRYLSEEGENKVSSSLLPKGSVSVSCIGSDMGKTVLVGEKSVTNQQINSVIVEDKFDNLFVYYNLSGRKSELQFLASGAAQPIMNKTDFSNLTIKVPPLKEQKAIASVLGALDDKIENNRRMNETLEEMARAIFKSWFVDFDPVHAKATGNPPAHMDAETASLFPSSFGDDGLPEGWKEEHLPNLIDFKEGPGLRNWQYTNSDEGIRFINIRCIKNKDLELTTANRVTELEAYGKYSHFLLEAGDIVVSTSGTLGRFSFVRKEHLPLMLNTSVIRMRPIYKKSTREFLYAYLGSKEFQNELEIRATGSAQMNFGPMHLNQMHVKVPKFEIINAYSKKISPVIEKFLSNQKENQTLAELRDTLLPKLMSGEIRVKDAEGEVEAVV